VASSTDEPAWARECLAKFTVNGSPLVSHFRSDEFIVIQKVCLPSVRWAKLLGPAAAARTYMALDRARSAAISRNWRLPPGCPSPPWYFSVRVPVHICVAALSSSAKGLTARRGGAVAMPDNERGNVSDALALGVKAVHVPHGGVTMSTLRKFL